MASSNPEREITSPPPPPPSCSSSLTMTQMDQDQIISILQLLPCESILSFSMTCKKLRSLASSESLWEFICKRDWGGLTSVDALVLSFQFQNLSFSWKRLYKEVSQLGSLSCHRWLMLSKDFEEEDDDDDDDDDDGIILPRPRASHSLNFVSDYLVLFGGGSEGG